MVRLVTIPALILLLIANVSYGTDEALIREIRAQIETLEQENKALSEEQEQNQKRLDSIEQRQQESPADQLGQGIQQAFQRVTTQAEQLWVTLLSPDRLQLFQQLENAARLPTPNELKRALDELESLIRATGQVGTASMPVIQGDGREVVQDVMFVGPFAVSSNDNFLIYQPESARLVTAPRQPSMVTRLYGASFRSSDRSALALDPLHGGLLQELAERPGVWQQIIEGGVPLWIILVLVSSGLLLAGWHSLFLHREMRKLKDHYWHLLATQKGQPTFDAETDTGGATEGGRKNEKNADTAEQTTITA